MEIIEVINPTEDNFVINFTKDECYKIKTGECSLDERFNENITTKMSGDRSSKEYCQRLYAAMRKKELFPNAIPISIGRASCGHYEISNGRHRICICQKRNIIVLEAEISNEGFRKCPECLRKDEAAE